MVLKEPHMAKTREYRAMSRLMWVYGQILVHPGSWIVAGKNGWPKKRMELNMRSASYNFLEHPWFLDLRLRASAISWDLY